EKQLEGQVLLLGNRERDEVRDAYMDAHFNILPSKSEGWPKAVAEGMFFGCVPIATSVSCVDWMLDYGSRGIVIKPELDSAVETIVEHLETNLTTMARLALEWSQLYTFDRLETDIKKVLDGTF
ncbi:MAG: glycosyltransferase, partial [Mangrovimonas sp.]|nr:glycosyltransferase [Mangrovimonas sp.]